MFNRFVDDSEVRKLSYNFECHRCGICCENLLKRGSRGLLLFPNEVKFFPENIMQPCLGKGRSPKHKNFKILAFQLNETRCPHYQDSSCKIYNQRPIACQAYPYSFALTDARAQQYLFQVDPECTAIIESKKSGELTERMSVTENVEITAAKEIGAWMIDFKKGKYDKRKQWIFNLKTKKWERFKVSQDRKKRVRKIFEEIKEEHERY